MCPVHSWASTVQWIMSYPKNPLELPDVSINMVFMEGKRFIISSKLLLSKIQLNVSSIDKDSLGFGPVHVVTHSNRSAAVTVMYFAIVPVYTIMLVRWWSSAAFLYICCQVLEFSNGAAARMIANEQFFPVPDFVHCMVDGDTRTGNNNSLSMTSPFNGMRKNMRCGLHPAFHLEH